MDDSDSISDKDDDQQRFGNYIRMMTSYSAEIFTPSEDPISLDCAAYRSRLPHDKMSEQEMTMFGELTTNAASHDVFLYIRNKILQHWIQNCREQVTIEKCFEVISSSFNAEHKLINDVFKYLERHGYINYGVYALSTSSYQKCKKSIIVIGAGIAGLTVARQLECFGFDVTVLEARNRVGGRISTYKKENYIAELGAMVVTGMGGNPLMILARQIPLRLREIKQECPLFDTTGKPVPKGNDDVIEQEFNRLLQACGYLGHTLKVNEMVEQKYSLGTALDTIVHLQEAHVYERHKEHIKIVVAMKRKLLSMRQKLDEYRTHINELRQEVDLLEREKNQVDQSPRKTAVSDFLYRTQHRELEIACDKYDGMMKELIDFEKEVAILDAKAPGDHYLSEFEKSVFYWHLANLEFANAAPLSKLSLTEWDQDDEHEFAGPHLSIQNGFSVITTELAEGLEILHSTAVREIEYSGKGVEISYVTVKDTDGLEPVAASRIVEKLKADAVVCTVPLGILKKSIESGKSTDLNVIKFTPPLPDWKKQSIERMGYGNLNKVILFFDRIFWDPNRHMFGNVNSSPAARGECFLFWAIYAKPVLIALNAGESADIADNCDEYALVHRCITVLRTIFGEVPQPKHHVVTRWSQDPWALGTYSNVGVDATGNDYDELARPVSISNDAQATLFFAGEHTCRHHPATVPGAMLSGLREAGRICDRFLN